MGELIDFIRSGESTKNPAGGPRLAATHELMHELPLLTQSTQKSQSTVDNLFGNLTLTNLTNDADTAKLATRPRIVDTSAVKTDDQQRTYKAEVPKKSAETKDEKKEEEKPEPKDEKQEEKQEQQTKYKSTEKWGGDEKATKQRHKPLEVGINEDGSGEITVKPGDTAWDYARRMLEEQGKKQNPPHQPTNQEILAKLKELETLNGRKLDVIHPGEKIKVSQKDVNDTKKEEKKEDKKGDGTSITTSKAGDKTYAVTRDANNDATKVEVTDAQGNKHVYEKHDDGLWYLDGKVLPDAQQVGIGFKHTGVVVLKDGAGNETQIYANGTVEETKNGKKTITTTDGTTYTEQENGDYVKKTPDGQETTIAAANFHMKGGVVSDQPPAQEEPPKEEENNEFDTPNGRHYSIAARDEAGNPTDFSVTYGGSTYHYKKNGDSWTYQKNSEAEVQLKGFDCRMDGQGHMVITEQQGDVPEQRSTRIATVGADGTDTVVIAPARPDEYETNSGKYVITHRDIKGVPDKFTVQESSGKEVHYNFKDGKWFSDANGQEQEVPELSVSFTEKGVIYVTRVFGTGTSRGASTLELNPDGTSKTSVTAPRVA